MPTIDEKLLLKRRFLNGCVPDQNDFSNLIDFFVPLKDFTETLLDLEEKISNLDNQIKLLEKNLSARINELSRFISELQMTIIQPSIEILTFGTDFSFDEPIKIALPDNSNLPSLKLFHGDPDSSLEYGKIYELPTNVFKYEYDISNKSLNLNISDGFKSNDKLFIYLN